jgi:hypothetical protein
VRRVQRLVDRVVPDGSAVAVLSRGDDDLVSFGQHRRGLHFPADREGGFAGHYPSDSMEAVVLLEASIAEGASYLVVPRTASWWLSHYYGFARELARRATIVADRADTATVYCLVTEPVGAEHSTPGGRT